MKQRSEKRALSSPIGLRANREVGQTRANWRQEDEANQIQNLSKLLIK